MGACVVVGCPLTFKQNINFDTEFLIQNLCKVKLTRHTGADICYEYVNISILAR